MLGAGVAAGAGGGIDWEEAKGFWAYQRPEKVALPEVVNGHWVRNEIDRFVLARLEAEGMSPSPEASAATLRRRLWYDLNGLPPSGEAAGNYEAEVERLLGERAFGERMAAMWLPVARYAEDQAHQVGKDSKHFYPNAYRYRDWVIGAFARDLPYDTFVRLQLAADQMEASEDDLPALGFIGLGPKYYNRGRLAVQAEEWEDRVDVFSRGLLGLTVACARCHDHKYDAVSMADYYALAGVFASTELVNQAWKCDESKLSKEEKAKRLHTVHVVKDGKVRNLPVYARGDVGQPGDEVPRGFLQVLAREGEGRDEFETGSGRAELAEVVVAPDNPLTARVFVNRVWAMLIGEGLVGTPSNFGELGERPTHPELLDWLAVDFVENGWSVKRLVRQIVGSATYRQSSVARPELVERDEANQLLWRANRKRLTVEMLRDALLSVSGVLEAGEGRSKAVSDPENRQRTVYGRVSRLNLDQVLEQWDFPDANVHCAERSVTTSPTQKLWLMNGPLVERSAAGVAERLAEVEGGREAKIGAAFELVLGRGPDAEEVKISLGLLEEIGGETDAWATYCHALLMSNEMLYVD